MIINVSRERRADTRNLFEVGDTGAHHALQAAEVFQQRAALGRPQSRNRLQHRFVITARAFSQVTGDSKSVRLVADALDQPRRW